MKNINHRFTKKITIILSFILILLFTFACDNFGSSNKGADLELIKSSIMGAQLIIDNEEWIIDNNTLDNVSIISQETTNEKDVVIVEVELKDNVLSATGQMQIEFTKNEEWVLADYRVSTPFVISLLPNAEMKWTDDNFLNEIIKHRIVYNEIAARTAEQIMTEQIAVGIIGAVIGMPFLSSLTGDEEPTEAILETFGMTASEISNFNIIYTEMTDKGSIQKIYTSAILSKGVIDYEIFSEFIFHYDRVNGWILDDVGFTSMIKEINLQGTKWSGTYEPYTNGNFVPNQLIVEFNEVTQNGSVKATVTAAPPEFTQALNGTLDTSSLTINLIFYEYISEPSFAGITLETGWFSVDEETVVEYSHINLNGTIDPLGTIIRSEYETIFEIRLS